MHPIDRATILRFHSDRIKNFGAGTAEALGWHSEGVQLARYNVLAEIGDFDGRLVLDVGCGHGDLLPFLVERFPQVRYAGIDHVPAFLDVAAARYGDRPEAIFYFGDFSTAVLPEADYVLASGALGYRTRDPVFVRSAITRLFGACRLGLGFNMLRRVDSPDGILAAHDPDLILEHCRSLSPHVVLREGYLDDDFTVLLYRGAVGG